MPDQDFSEQAGNLPSDPFERRWFIHSKSKTHGPYTGHQIKKVVDEGQFPRSQLVFPEGQAGSEWVQIGDDPILGTLFRQSERDDSSRIEAIGTNRRFRKSYLFATAIIAVAGWIFWPYYAAYELATAFRDGDVATLEDRVDWDEVREGLRGDLNAALLKHTQSQSTSSEGIGAGFAALLGPVIVNQIINNFVTPQAIAVAMHDAKSNPPTSTEKPKDISKGIQAARDIQWNKIEYAFFSGPFTFLVQYNPDYEGSFDEPLRLRFEWDGTWRLVRVYIPVYELKKLASNSSAKSGSSLSDILNKVPTSSVEKNEPTSSTKRSETLDVTLISKTFVPMDLNANQYQDYIAIKININNMTSSNIRAFDGILEFTDMLGNEVFSSKVAINEPIKGGESISWGGEIKFNQFLDAHQIFRNAKQENLKVHFKTRKILFADGTEKTY